MTPKIAALLLADEPRGAERRVALAEMSVGGLTLLERAALAVSRAGIDRVYVAGAVRPDEALGRRLAARGVQITWMIPHDRPFDELPRAERLVVVSLDTLFEPRALRALLDGRRLASAEAALAIDSHPQARGRLVAVEAGKVRSVLAPGGAANAGLLVLTPPATERLRGATSLLVGLERLAAAGVLAAVDIAPYFARRLWSPLDRAPLERALIEHLNGGAQESYFTKKLRRWSVPLTQRLLRSPVTANQVTLASFVLALGAGICFAVGTYWAGLLGALLYYVSSVLDCSDGEVARMKFNDSAFGCWLETAADYASYLFVWAGLTAAVARTVPTGLYRFAAGTALAATLLVFALTAYLRQRVAGANPGQFDEMIGSSCARRGGPLHRFSGWGRQWLKRSTLAHLLVALALVDQLPLLLLLWAIGASMALVVGVLVSSFLVRHAGVVVPSSLSSLVARSSEG
jgi:phosphatidylglycerophosphate synthase